MIHDVIVAGCGGVGSAALHQLVARGAKVLGIDRFVPPHDRGSTHGKTRVIRLAYFEHPDYVPLLRRSYELWSALEKRAGKQLYVETGVLEVGPPNGEVVPGVLKSAALHGLEVEQLTADEITRRFPLFRVPPSMCGVLEKRGGYLWVEDCVAAHLEGAPFAREELISWRSSNGVIEVETSEGVRRANKLIVAAGAWAPKIFADLRIRFEVVKKTMFWYRAVPAYDWPAYLFETPRGVYYGLPSIAGQGAKVAEHSGGSAISDPSHLDRARDEAEARRCETFLADHLPALKGPPIADAPCMYTLAPDRNFVLDLHPHHKNVVLCAGLSGHGFKLTPALGEACADLAESGATKLPISIFSIQRPALY